MSRGRWLFQLLSLWLVASGCGSGRPSIPPPGGSAGDKSPAAGSGGSDNSNPDALLDGGIKPGDEVPGACVGQTQGAQEVPLDMYIMLDRSASMLDRLDSGETLWDAIRQALTGFIRDPASRGIGVGLQYFPLAAAGVPDSCASDRDCGSAGGQCTSKACKPSASGQGGFTLCLSDVDCPTGSGGCVPFGLCTGDQSLACLDIGSGGCADQGDCVPFPGECTKYASCAVDDYAAPAVPIAALPDNAPGLVASLDAELPKGATPTAAALSGALALATAHAKQNLNHRVIVVLATDGLPTQCFPSSVQSQAQAVTYTAQVAQRGYAAHPSILSYVIGVLGADSDSSSNLDKLASSGGTKKALVIDQTSDVAANFLAALASVREGSLACEFTLPDAPADQTLDFNLINVQFVNADVTKNLLYVGSVDRCAKAALGWYYDVDPSTGAIPTKISVCPRTCDSIRAATGATIEIRLGCATLAPS